MQNSYHVYRSRQDIGSRIRYLHSEVRLSIALIDMGGREALIDAIEYYHTQHSWPITVFLSDSMDILGELRMQFPLVTFIHFPQPASTGAMINVMANECYATYFLVTRSDLRISALDEGSVFTLFERGKNPAVLTPHIRDRFDDLIPTVEVPRRERNLVDPLPFIPWGDLNTTLYPFMGLGIYERALFQRLRGFDEAISGEYWQFLDFGMRCWLYGYSIFSVSVFQLRFPYRQFIIENRTPQGSVNRVMTKSLAFRQINGKNSIRRIGRRTDSQYLKESMKKRLALFKMDFNELIENWSPPEYPQEGR